ncbi:MAG: tRNA-intron lyase [Candidatus Geothermarchaeales archaeon]
MKASEKEKPIAYLEETRAIIWDLEDSSRVFSLGFYGKPIGVPKPKPGDLDAPLVLDLIEAAYLAKNGSIEVYDPATGRNLALEEVFGHASRAYDAFEEKFMVYEDLRSAGYVVTSGMKFGSTFAVYRRGPGIDHAPFIVSIMRLKDAIGSTDIVRAGRLATTVRKRFVIAVPNLKTGKVQYLLFRWWKA